ncbi:PIN domain nuclease [Mycobacterium shinjukuense]|uniref:Ribonuclease VapC n=1 Tax=Mycobacterium shinjukuense TaxID=398694 RepID=A0A7I7MNW5_9MYCO|nr:PIN domain nuclease [Mycobacterium shinjukuense]MCV6986612.1 PIN domain nuclease [Mycobacterium shinjukuense]ORB61532.1 VapC toxin family PIN domain ribonuclease [Mycobacterium shinjukuense]BBX72989.1 ribonuclease VapC [Mycobacterium shinjukuense]
MAAVARYLADTSALARLNRPAVDAALSPLIETGQVATCGMVELEVLYSARNPADYARRQQQLRDGFERLAMPDEVWQRALEVQAALARKSAHRGAALPDLLIAATAERHGVTVLHYDHEYELIAAVTEQSVRWIVPSGTADGT